VAFKVKKEILSKLRGDLERRGLIESVLINVAGDDNDKKNKDKDKKRTVRLHASYATPPRTLTT
jgi:hypothetical protein